MNMIMRIMRMKKKGKGDNNNRSSHESVRNRAY